MTNWINVKDQPPKKEGWYLVYTKPDKGYKSINKAEFCKGYEWNNFTPYWRGAGGHWGNVAYWMPLPEPPIPTLKFCPLCGFVAVYDEYIQEGIRVRCTHCDYKTKFFKSKLEAANYWNGEK
jgi:hypothetical protein